MFNALMRSFDYLIIPNVYKLIHLTGNRSLIDDVMAGEDDQTPNDEQSSNVCHEMKSYTSVFNNDGNRNGCEDIQYLERRKYRGDGSINCNKTSNNNMGRFNIDNRY